MKNAMPDFMSRRPAPTTVHRPRRNGISRSVPMRPNGIGMPERQNLPVLLAARQRELAAKMLAETAARNVFDLAATGPAWRQQIDEAVDRGGIVARRFAFHQLADERDDLGLMRRAQNRR